MNKHLARWNTCCEKLHRTPINCGETSISLNHRTGTIKSVIVKTCQSVQTFLYKWKVYTNFTAFYSKIYIIALAIKAQDLANHLFLLIYVTAKRIRAMIRHEDGVRS